MRPLPMPAGGARGERIETVNLLDACEHLVKLARKAGASEAEAYAERTRDASVRVRDGEVEELQQASSKGIGLRVITGQRLGFSYGTDLSTEGLKKIAETAVALAKGAAKDKANGLPRGRELGAAEHRRVRPGHRRDLAGVEAAGRPRGGEGGARRGPAGAQVRFHRRRRLPLALGDLLQPRCARRVAGVVRVRVLLAGGRSGRTAPDGFLERHAAEARDPAASGRGGPHRGAAGGAHAGRARRRRRSACRWSSIRRWRPASSPASRRR